MTSPYRAAIAVAADAHGLNRALVEAVVRQESDGRADAFRHEPDFWRRYCAGKSVYRDQEPRRVASSYGLMQIMFPTAQMFGFRGEPEELFGIAVNLDVGCRVLAGLLAKFGGDLRPTLAAYNGGPGNADKPVPLRYADQVLARFHHIEASLPL